MSSSYKICLLLNLLGFFSIFNNSTAQETKAFGVKTGVIKASYEKIADQTFSKLWDESVTQQIKIPLFDEFFSVDLVIGGGVVSFDTLMMIPELKKMVDDGTFPKNRIFIKHVCELNIKIKGSVESLIEGGVEFPYRVTLVESLAEEDGAFQMKLKKRIYSFFIKYTKMMYRRFDKGITAFEDSLLPANLNLKPGERFSVERYALADFSFGTTGFEFKWGNPVLNIEGKAKVTPFGFSKTFGHIRLTVQGIGLDNLCRITISKKKINSFEFFNAEFGFDIKTRKKLFSLFRISLDINLLKFTPEKNFYKLSNWQYIGKLNDPKFFTRMKRIYFWNEKKFIKQAHKEVSFFRKYQVKGRNYTNNLNLFNIYRNSRKESIENRVIHSHLNKHDNMGVGVFDRYKTFFLNSKKFKFEMACDYSHHLNKVPVGVDRSGVLINIVNDDTHGLSSNKLFYMKYVFKILEGIQKESTSELRSFFLKDTRNHYKRKLVIEFDAIGFKKLFEKTNPISPNVMKYCHELMNEEMIVDKNKRKKVYTRAMVKKIIKRIHKMSDLLRVQFVNSRKKGRFIKNIRTIGQLPIKNYFYLILAMSVAPEYVKFTYDIELVPHRSSPLDEREEGRSFQFKFIGKKFKGNMNQLKFYY
ncbi:MAG: hypothetical protein COA79_19680 [Planctomycetota bacterium]|nr:MAG: hypothetical protein COA79_19680 [Planctomycetota bacterium]